MARVPVVRARRAPFVVVAHVICLVGPSVRKNSYIYMVLPSIMLVITHSAQYIPMSGSSFSHFLQKPKRWSALTFVSYEHLLSGRYMSTHRASRSISAQAVAPSVTFLSTKQTSWVARVRSSGPVRDGETKILNAPTSKANHMIMRIRCVVCTKSKASRKCFRELRHIN